MADEPIDIPKPLAGATDPVGPGVPTGEETRSPKPARPLTPEEQMAAFEESLKESDWGHQPC